MEVIIDYYEEEYPCFIYPDRTVLANKEEIAVWDILVGFYIELL